MTGGGRRAPLSPEEPDEELEQQVTLLELVNRTIDRGVVLHGDAVISVADVDLVELRLRLVLAAVDALEPAEDGDPEGGEDEP